MIVLLAIVLGGLALRLFRLGTQSLWFDEAQTLDVAGYPLAEIARRTYRPPLFHMFMHYWMRLAGDSEFWLRLPSALFGACVPPLAYAVAMRLYNRRTGLLAASLAAISPTLIWYAQELRMYSLMVAQFLILLYLTLRLLDDSSHHRRWLWGAFVAVQVMAMYTHYFALPFLVWLAGLTVLLLAYRRRWRLLGLWIGAQAATAVAYVPWLLVALGGRGGTEDYTAAETLPVMTHIPGVREALVQNWTLYTTGIIAGDTGLTGLLSRIELLTLGAALLVLLGAAVWNLRTARNSTRGAQSCADLWLLALIAVPTITAVLMFRFRPGVVHARHLMMIAGPLMVLLGRAASLAFRVPLVSVGRSSPVQIMGRLVGVAVLAAFLAGFGVGVDRVLLRPHQDYVRADSRSLARDVASLTGEGDIVILPYVDYAFNHYFHGAAQVYYLETRVGDSALLDWVVPRIQGAGRAALVRWVDVYADPRDMLPWFLQSNGRLERHFWQAGRWVSIYDLQNPITPPLLRDIAVRVGPLALRGMALPQGAAVDQRLPIALWWESVEPPGVPFKVSVQVEDPSGHIVAMDDRVILSERDPIDAARWLPGKDARNYYLPALLPGSPPISYTLAVSVYYEGITLDVLDAHGAPAGTRYVLGTVETQPARNLAGSYPDDLFSAKVNRELAPGLVLEGYQLGEETLPNGGSLPVTLYWRASSAPLPAYEPEVRLVQEGDMVAGSQRGSPAYGLYPCNLWREGELVIDRRIVRVSPDAGTGTAKVVLVVDGAEMVLGVISIESTNREFTLPQEIQHPMDVTLGDLARLRGFDVEAQSVVAGGPLRVTLYWEAMSDTPPPTDHAVFIHLVDPQRQMVAQHDGAPADGRWATSTWVQGQIIVDTHELAFRDEGYIGQATLEVGMYDPVTFRRLTTASGEDHIVLPLPITIMR
jgi:4-amino-4-deoxy-L-arabinose transferase-like glycosyltransferase